MMKTLSLLKRYCLLLAILVASAIPSQAGYVWECPIEWNGDVNRDGNVDIADVADLIDALLENNQDGLDCDVNVNGVVNIADVTDLIDMLLYEPDDYLLPFDTLDYKMIYVRSDIYTMGATQEQEPFASENEREAHQVRQYPFYIGQTEVTQDLWQAVMGGNPSHFKGKRLPVQNVSWEDCQEFIMRLNRYTGMRFRLPTEAEWELAARGGRNRHNYVYAGSNTLADVGWFDSNSGERPQTVKSLQPNELQIYDMSGNVWEWCQDFWAPGYSADFVLNPLGPETGTSRVLRGGSWLNLAANCRVSSRNGNVQTLTSYTTGFRLAMDAPYNSWFMLADKIVYLKVGEQRSVDILNGNGSYTVYNGNSQIVNSSISGEHLLLKGLKVGTTSVIVKDNLSGDKASVTVIVYRPANILPDTVGVPFNMIYVEGGISKLGATDEQGNDAYNNESPAHAVTLSNYYIGETEVTQALWQAVMGNNPSSVTGDLYRPVERVSWLDCMEFLDRLNEITGREYRLPTEAEWEYAARGGIFSQGFKYAGSDDVNAVAWYSSNSGGKTHTVATKDPNELGVYDMSGNVFEWCQDWMNNYTTGIHLNPSGPSSGSARVNRGGAWSTSARVCRVSYRRSNTPSVGINTIGLRLAMDAPGTNRFRLSRHLVKMEVGEHRTLNILNGSGDYTVVNGDPNIVEGSIDGEHLLLTGLSVGMTGMIVKDNATGAQDHVTVIVTQRRDPEIIPVLNDTIWMEFVKGGTFDMGGTPESVNEDDLPVHPVTLSSYYICNREVTQHLWYAVMGNNPSKYSPAAGYGDDLYKPVESVSWYDCQRFIARLNMITGLNFRMPTEAEWEFAARGGNHSKGYIYAGSNVIDDVAWYVENSNNETHHCGLKLPNELDLYDMTGNVMEWCQDWFGSYSSNAQKNPIGPITGTARICRGSSYNLGASYCRLPFRGAHEPRYKLDMVGLRLAMDAEEVENPNGPDGGDVNPRFRLSRTVVTLEVGEQVDVSILHGSGNYTVFNQEEYVLADVNGEKLTLTGKAVGVEDVIVKDNDTQQYALVTAIVVEPVPVKPHVLDDSVYFDMVYIPEGAFVMGDDAVPGAAPAHYVTVDGYYIGSTEVTNLMWRWVMDYPINWNAADLYKPVEGLSWDECQDFIARLNEKTGREYRLPTEAEWEYAAMGANRSKGYRYAGSNTAGDVAWYWDNLPSQQIGTAGYGVQRVSGKRANEKGIYDMSGNVREWCQDWFGVYPMGIQINPGGPETGTDRVLRGGCYLDSSEPCRVKARSASRQSGANYVGTGFRLAMDAVRDTVTPERPKMTLSKNVIRIPVGEQRHVNILNGSGSYTLYNSNPAIATCLQQGEILSLEGLKVGTTDVKVVDNVTLATAYLTVIVYKPDSGGIVPGPDELFNEPNMILVHGGTFVRGATSDQGASTQADESPIHQVTVSTYYISQTEVTQRLWQRVMGGNPSHFKDEKSPVEQVTWEDCQEFIRRLNEMTGRQYRMLTEAEWEYAARGGRLSMGYKYAGANTVSNLGWYKGNSGSTSHEVAKKTPNELGVYDMSGNVWEWCQDVYGTYSADNQFNPVGLDAEFSGGEVARVMRGGAWDSNLSDCRVARRMSGAQDYSATNVGLRLAMDGPMEPPLSVDHRVVELKVGEQATVNILNGTGDYSATGGGSIASFQLSGSTLTVTGQQVGTTTINIKDNLTMARTVVTVIVTETRVPHTYKTITFWIRYISGGAFDMGATDEQGSDAAADESPVHRAMVPSFGIGETEVTQELWQAVMGYNPSVNTGNLQQPVDNVTWEEAEQFVARLSDLCDKPYRLPTEAEWEYAARGGRYGSTYKYAGSNTIGNVAWYSGNSGGTSHPVAAKSSNGEYLYDMSGNVDEWCHDWYAPYSADPVFDPEGPDSADYHVARGGRWDSPAAHCRVSARSADGFGETLPGVRIALERPYSYWFSLSRSVVWLKVGDSRTVDIYNGSGSYTIYSSKAGIVSYVVDGDQISLTGLKEGRTVLQVMDNVSHEHKTLTVIVRNPIVLPPGEDPDPYVDPEPTLNSLLKMVFVRGGTFAMGATSEQGSDIADDENPSHLVTLSSYYVSETEVTQALWKRVMGGNPSHLKGDNLPVEQVTWEECQEFISRLNNLTGRQYRLLTEAEWEYAARGGNKSNNYKYAGSNTVGNVAWYSGNSNNTVHNVKLKTKNELGIYDMSGNVGEWCQDVYGAYSADNQRNPVGAAAEGAVCNRVVRGGAWDGAAAECRVSSRASRSQDYSDSHIGLRLARDAYDADPEPLMVVTHRVVEMEVGEQATVGIVNGSGNYVASGGGGIVSYSLSGSTLTLTALAEGKTTVNVKDNTSGVWTIVTVIVTEGEIPYIYRNIKFWIKYINGGAFEQGATEEQGTSANADESPVHRSMLPAYGIGKYEVTQELWQAVMGYNNSVNRGNLQLPVDNITWEEAQEFVSRLSDIFDMPFRLPTEAEWEYAARGARGSKGYKYAGGNSASTVAWYSGNSGGTTHAVGTKRANERSLYDMSGNVDEWCQDWYGPYSEDPALDPTGPMTGQQHVVRGGRWSSAAADCRVSARSAGGFGNTLPGLRVALEYPYSYYFTLSRETIWMEVGDNRTVTIFNGSGSYTISSSVNGVASYVVSGEKLLLTGLQAGHTIITVLDNVAQEAKTISVTVDEPAGTNEPENVDGAAFEMIYVSGGTFQMGGTEEQGTDAYTREKPVHRVTLHDFKISNIEVTQELWQNVMGSNPSTFTGNLQLPVDNVSWEDCQLFIAKLNEKTGKHYRLPTEAEWEYAARGGSRSLGYKYAGGNTIGNVAWYSGNASNKTHVVGSKNAPNELGIHDMSGNVMEWCQDWYGSYTEGQQTNPTGPTSGTLRCMRGGSWNAAARACRVSHRLYYAPTAANGQYGLRLVEDVDNPLRFGLSSTMLTMEPGDQETVNILNGSGDYTLDAGSSVVTCVLSGESITVTANEVGATTVSVTDNATGESVILTVLVTQPVAPFGLSQSELTMEVGNTATIDILNGRGNYTVAASTAGIVNYLVDGETLTLTAVKAGTVTLTVTDVLTGSTATLTITVTAPPETTAKPVFSYEMTDDAVIVTATGNGVVIMYVNGLQVENPYALARGEQDYTVTVTATAQEEGKLISETAQAEVYVPALASQSQGHEYVDLGLPSGTLWATTNVGATSPEDYGDYFAWGETEPKTTYSWATYKWCNGSSTTLTKYNTDSSHGAVDNKTELEPEDDAATVNWGESWRMPSIEQINELVDNCTMEWITRNSVKGRLVTGPNGNTMFLPASGSYGSSIGNTGYFGFYWSRMLRNDVNTPYESIILFLTSGEMRRSSHPRYLGLTVRPVRATESTPVGEESFTVNGVTFKMITVDGGTFMMGDDNASASNQKPAHQVTLSSFGIGQTEVTQELWQAVMGSNPSNFTGDLQNPVEKVSWFDCQTFLMKLNQLTGKQFRLPTASEWEFSARGGNSSHGYSYSGSDTIDVVAWCSGNSSNTTHPVATKRPNELGIYDMTGNVLEWCQDMYASYTSNALVDPVGGISSSSNREVRGGYYSSDWIVTRRSTCAPSEQYIYLGLRLAMDQENTAKFRLSHSLVTMNIREAKSLTILNGSGNYSIAYGKGALASVQISGNTLTVTGVSVGTSSIIVTDNATGRQAVVNVIVTDTDFRLSTNDLTIEVGEQWPVAIFNGGGNYTVTGGGTVVSTQISDNHLLVTGTKTGTTTLTVTDTSTGNTATLHVTVKASTGTKEFFDVNGTCFTMVKVDGGEFEEGGTGDANVTLSSYYIGQTEVTQALWQAVMGSNPSNFTGNSYRPVEKISWFDCQEFLYKLNQLTGCEFRMLSASEWEFAARGGNNGNGYTYAGSNTIGDVAWYWENASYVGSSSPAYGTHEVALKAPNELGLYDMTGNVSEWVYNWSPRTITYPSFDPMGPATGTYRGVFGGGWSTSESNCSVLQHSYTSPSGRYNGDGLRLALDDLNASRFRLSETVIKMEVGQSMSVSILNGGGSYTVAGGTDYATSTLSGNTLTVKGNYVGTTSVIVTNTSTGAQAAVTVIITPATNFRLFTDAISIGVGEQRAVQISNGGSNYSVSGGGTVASKQISGDHLLVTGLKAGTTTLTVTDSSSGATATLRVTVVNDANRQSFTVGGVTFTMVTVVGGTFTMGDDNATSSNQKPAHQVTLSSYSIGQTEVTQALWQAVMGGNPSNFTGNPYRPVEKVSWNDCQEFIYKLNQMTGKKFRLPTEAEWEFAALGGNSSQGYTYSGSNVIGEVAWYQDNAYYVGSSSPEYGTHEVATKSPNELGLYDMTGNVDEFCSDLYGNYSSAAQTNPAGSTTGNYRVYRGADWAWTGSVKDRNNMYSQTSSGQYYGLRLALDVAGSGKFQLSETVVKVGVGGSKSVNILNGNGSYTAEGGTANFTSSVSGNKLTVTGTTLGTNTVIVTNTSTGAQAVLTVIVTNDPMEEVTPKPTITYEVEDNDVVIAATGEGHILLYCDDNLRAEGEGAAWLTIPRDEEDRDYTITATAQAEGMQISETAIMEIIVPALETPPPSGEDFTVNGVTFTMITVEGGTFMMGASNSDTEANDDFEKPSHQVTLSTYKIGQTEVTQDLWQAVMGSNPSYFTGSLQRPVESISWIHANEFISRLNQLTGKKFRLPTDAEWEFAARGGIKSNGYKYAGGNSVGSVAWYSGNSNNTTHDVATKQANELSLYDMSGNVGEWTQDMWYYYSNTAQTDPNLGDYFVNSRNGGYDFDYKHQRVSYRNGWDDFIETNRFRNVGLRLALDDENTTKFRLSETVIELEAGKQATVNILNGNGSYTVSNIEMCSEYEGLVTSQVSGNSLIVTDQNPGIDRLKVTNTSTGATAVLTVIVTEAAVEEHEYVDLGLPSGTLWATCNVGASSPEEYGDYFAWGETEPKETYDWTTYKWCNGTYYSMTKYCNNSSYGTVDNKTELEVADDAATANWGSSWRMPSYDQQTELIEKCSWTWRTQNGVNGYLVTGSNGNTLFLPAAGYRWAGAHYDAGSNGSYWSRTLSSPSYAYYLDFVSGYVDWYGSYRGGGFTVRAVRVQ